MRRILVVAALVVSAMWAQAQTGPSTGQPALAVRESEHYRLATDLSAEMATVILAKLEAAYDLFADLFHFVPERAPLRVTIFAEKARFDAYLASVIKESRSDFVYIHYADAAKSELVGFFVPDERQFDASLLHQACIQFIKGHVANPPVWLRDGTAAYLERSAFNPETRRFQFKPNLLWLDALKAKLGSPQEIPLSRLIFLDAESARAQLDSFYPQAWALVSFLLESPNQEINRLYWDSLAALDPAASLAENSARVHERAFGWYDEERLQKQYREYAASLKGFNELVSEGSEHYANRRYDQAREAFLAAMRIEPDSYVPYYYLGLIDYASGDYHSAEVLFKSAMDLGADPALTQYALGVNAFASNRYEQSRTYLLAAKAANPAAYGEKVDSLLARMSTLR